MNLTLLLSLFAFSKGMSFKILWLLKMHNKFSSNSKVIFQFRYSRISRYKNRLNRCMFNIKSSIPVFHGFSWIWSSKGYTFSTLELLSDVMNPLTDNKMLVDRMISLSPFNLRHLTKSWVRQKCLTINGFRVHTFGIRKSYWIIILVRWGAFLIKCSGLESVSKNVFDHMTPQNASFKSFASTKRQLPWGKVLEHTYVMLHTVCYILYVTYTGSRIYK